VLKASVRLKEVELPTRAKTLLSNDRRKLITWRTNTTYILMFLVEDFKTSFFDEPFDSVTIFFQLYNDFNSETLAGNVRFFDQRMCPSA